MRELNSKYLKAQVVYCEAPAQRCRAEEVVNRNQHRKASHQDVLTGGYHCAGQTKTREQQTVFRQVLEVVQVLFIAHFFEVAKTLPRRVLHVDFSKAELGTLVGEPDNVEAYYEEDD
jgi:hypothetical protein